MRFTTYGAAETVTGSCHLLESNVGRIVVDCGLFQGEAEADDLNRGAFPFSVDTLDAVVLTHGHLDHVGRLPLLVKQGFRGTVISTEATAEIAQLILMDSARIQVEDAAYRAKRAKRRGEQAPEPLYDEADVLDVFRCAWKRVAYGDPVQVGAGMQVVLRDAGHILGSATVEISDGRRSVVFSGDLGSSNRPIIGDPEPIAADLTPDMVVLESTYGDRNHRSLDDSVRQLREAIVAIVGGGGNLLIPSFALERTQEVLYELFKMWRDGELPLRTRIYLDSPLAIAVTRVFERHRALFDLEGQALFAQRPNPFEFPPLQFTRTTEESKRINASGGGNIIVAGSGMCNGGRIVHHLRHNLWREDSGVFFLGFQARGTLGRRLVEGASSVRIFGDPVSVEARIFTVNGFSAHADQRELVAWIDTKPTSRVMLVHGEPEAIAALKQRIAQTDRQPRQVDVAVHGVGFDV
ncbi:MBL fold metallo-hydrolase [Candidatus Bipolaricaulota bacterium]|nr:MBL fold metallo-hydrolase [Candidatus Bipolaricaulota bacterium]